MKKITYLLFLILICSCDSQFDFNDQLRQEYTVDEDGDPVIENVDEEEFDFGVFGGYCYGYNLPPGAEKAVTEIEVDIPTLHDISVFLPEVGNQGKQGSCVGWATGYYLKSFQENYEDNLNGAFVNTNSMSPAYIYNQIKVSDCNAGSVIQDALDLISSEGIVDLTVMPYNENDCDTQPNALQKSLASSNKINNYAYLDEELVFEQTKAFLLNDQPVVIAIQIDSNYFGARDENGNYIYRKHKNTNGSHAMLVVGYDDDMNAFKVVNSWGKNWGNSGFVWIDYQAFQEAGNPESDFAILCEAWVTEDIMINQPASL